MAIKLSIPTHAMLSASERRVIDETLAGYSISQIASKMDLAYKSVCTYRLRAFNKLGISSDRELFQWYGLALHDKHGDMVPASALLNPGIDQLKPASFSQSAQS